MIYMYIAKKPFNYIIYCISWNKFSIKWSANGEISKIEWCFSKKMQWYEGWSGNQSVSSM